jgi:hypothetical protein
MIPLEGRLVVTAADPARRIVHEFNGRPARLVYEKVIGTTLQTGVAARFPFGYYVGGRAYVRSVMGSEGDSLRFASAVERGTVLAPMRAGSLAPATETALATTTDELGGDVAALIAFNCYGRFLEMDAAGLTADLGRIMTRYPVVGFNSFGEQINALHINHSLTALVFARGGEG